MQFYMILLFLFIAFPLYSAEIPHIPKLEKALSPEKAEEAKEYLGGLDSGILPAVLYPPLAIHAFTHIDDRLKKENAYLWNKQQTDTRSTFYVNHILVALYFWNTDYMYDIIAFEIGRFRKKPELIFAMDTTDWAQSLFCVQHMVRTKKPHIDLFIQKFYNHLRCFTATHYKSFLPYECHGIGSRGFDFSYKKSEFLIKPYQTYQTLSQQPTQIQTNKYAGIISSNSSSTICAQYEPNCSIIYNYQGAYNEHYSISIDFEDIDTK